MTLEWLEVVPEARGDLRAETIFAADLPLSDLRFGKQGQLAFLRRQPGRADVFYWPTFPQGEPGVWTTGEAPGILDLFGVGEGCVYCRGFEEIMRVTKNGVEVIARGGLTLAAAMSPDQSMAVWIEEEGARKCCLLAVIGKQCRRLDVPFEPLLAAWCGREEIFVCGGRSRGGDVITRLARVDVTGTEMAFSETHLSVTRIAADPESSLCAWSGPGFSPRVAARSEDRRPGVWLGAPGAEAHCVSNALPTSNLEVVKGGSLFATHLNGRSGFVWATTRGARFAATDQAVRAFVVDNNANALVFATPGRSGAIQRLPLAGFVA